MQLPLDFNIESHVQQLKTHNNVGARLFIFMLIFNGKYVIILIRVRAPMNTLPVCRCVLLEG